MQTAAARLPSLPQASRALLLLSAPLALVATARADALHEVQVLRAGGCGGLVPIARPLERSEALQRTAAEWARGGTLADAAVRNGQGQVLRGVHVISPDASLLEALRRSECRVLTDRSMRAIGVFHRGEDYWLVLNGAGEARSTSGAPQPPASSLPRATADTTRALAARALELVNAARARGARCGRVAFAPAPPVTLSGTLAGVAYGHATDMATHNYFEHADLGGQSPADRVRASGYEERLVGENIAYGPKSVEEAVQGWLDSPDHCENIMDPRFAQMGIASAPGHSSRRGLYWVQILAEPRA